MKKQMWIVVMLVLCAGVPLFLLTRHRPMTDTSGYVARQEHVQGTERRQVQLAGEVLDIACYLDNNLHGSEHKKCAAACLRDGQPIGFLDDQGKVYLLIEDHTAKTAYRMLAAYAAERVDVGGELIERGGIQSILVREVHHPSRISTPANAASKRVSG